MWALIKGWIGTPSLKSVSMMVLIVMVCIAAYLGWRWLDGVLTTVETQTTAINNLNKTIGSKDQQISTLDTARQAAEKKAEFYAAKTEILNKESQVNAKQAQEYQQKSNVLQQKLRELQSEDKCAKAAVSDDVIRMQRESIDAFNAKYSR
ncbi:hypothetical protein R4R92_004522 [Citrobacter freundii]|uniref:hypothetical protein n=1 Tax=Citrobacter TaxID=544 RepID=UPI0015EA6E5F|nr:MULTISPECIES: hypothetical protein [Citrobacter]ELK1250041.1 hypothetical protein [Citrobacter freundii]ELR9593991.1 hypothetical protein [Citrobacter freundii]MDC8910611.1 hypothetical protein [Citrobacter freundii]MDM2902759.1 hypothetical protein [Citrobacter sp. Cpo037]MDM3343764.1 hypothetical protein [Citrobacter sp. Cf115]